MSATASRGVLLALALALCTAATEIRGDEDAIERVRPGAPPREPTPAPEILPGQIPPPEPWRPRESVAVPDRWRIVKTLELLPYRLWDPYNPNPLKGDLPIRFGADGVPWFFNLTAISDTVLEWRQLPTPVGVQSTLAASSPGPFGRGRQSAFGETLIASLSLIKGNTVFRPPDYEFRFVPVANFNRARVEEARVVYVDPARGPVRNDGFFGVQELFADKHLRDVSARYDFDSLRVGIQPFNADFRGLLFIDQPFGMRLFGTRDNNLWQYNLAWFRRLEKDTNSGLNDLGQRLRADDVFVFNLYRQDWPVLGFTTQAVALHNRNREGRRGQFYNANGFLERPAVFGSGRAHDYRVTYLGLNGDGHLGRWNLTASAYLAFGQDERGMLSGLPERIVARFAAYELSRDFDWLRVRLTGAYASGDRNPFDARAEGFDAVLENPLLAGAATSYWIRQAVPLVGGGGVALSMRNGLLASLRTSREHGQSNFTNPGLRLLGAGVDADLTPQLRLFANLNKLSFDNLSSLAALRNQRLASRAIGWDASFGVHYRPLFIQNIVVNASVAVLRPGRGLRALYGDALDPAQYSVLVNAVFTF